MDFRDRAFTAETANLTKERIKGASDEVKAIDGTRTGEIKDTLQKQLEYSKQGIKQFSVLAVDSRLL